MVQFRRPAPLSHWRFAAGLLVTASALRCHAPSDDRLFEPVLASPSPPIAGAAGAAALSDPGERQITTPGAGGSTESIAQPSGLSGGAEGEAPSMGVAGAMALPEANGPPGMSGASGTGDAGVAPTADCVLGEFQAPEPLTGLEQGLNQDQVLKLWSPSLSADGHTLVFAINGDGVNEQIETAARADRGTVFSPATAVGGVNTVGENGTPMLSVDSLSLYFFSTRPGGLGDRDIWFATRPDVASTFKDPTLVAGVNGPTLDHLPWVSSDGLTLLWATDRAGGVGLLDIWIARRSALSDGFSNAAPLNGVNTTSNEGRAVLSKDELSIYFASDQPGGVGSIDLWVATRSNRDASFSHITNLPGLNSAGLDTDPFLSADDRELLFASDRDGSLRLWRSVRDCLQR